MNAQILCPTGQDPETVFRAPVLLPFSSEILSFVEEFSRSVLSERRYRNFPELVALAFWFRKSQVLKMRRMFEESRQDRFRIGRGLVFHVAPANVDTLFVYSFFLSMIAGNSNIVRVSSRRTEQQAELLHVLNELLKDAGFAAARDRLLIVSYEHNDEVTASVSSRCDVRVLWGGDETVTHIRTIPLPPAAVELTFPDRFSLCLLRSRAVLESRDLEGLINGFYNDSYWFDQMACSSTKLVAWLGSEDDTEQARGVFWPALEGKAIEKSYPFSASQAIDKLETEHLLAALGSLIRVEPSSTNLARRIFFDSPEQVRRELHCGSGLFYEIRMNTLDELERLILKKDQTVTSYGFSRADWTGLLTRIRPRGIDRVVPVGRALEFSLVWDGRDLLREFCREVEVLEGPPA